MHVYRRKWLWLIGFALVYCVGVNEQENQSSREKNVSEQYLFCREHKSVYCVYTRNLGANLWLLLGAKSMPFGCMSMAWLGAKYAEVGCKSMDTFGCTSIPFGCMSMARLGACMRLLGACLTVGSFPLPQAGPRGPRGLGPWALWAPGASGPTTFRACHRIFFGI